VPVNLSIKEVPDALAERLRFRAQRNHRSLQGELMAIIEDAAREDSVLRAESQRYPSERSAAQPRGHKTIEQIAAEHRVLYPEPMAQWPLAVDIVRADRDAQ